MIDIHLARTVIITVPVAVIPMLVMIMARAPVILVSSMLLPASVVIGIS